MTSEAMAVRPSSADWRAMSSVHRPQVSTHPTDTPYQYTIPTKLINTPYTPYQ